MKAKLVVLLFVAMVIVALAGCGNSSGGASAAGLADGVYSADFTTDNSMFHVNEANNGKGVLTVKGGKMTIHVSLVSESIVNLFVGTAEEAQKDGAALLKPTIDSVTYKDGTKEQVYGFDIPVPATDKKFAVALVGTKGKWYDHMVSVSNPTPAK
jgi:heme-binding NEAT domain protein